MMKCKDAVKLIPQFLEDDLDNRDLAEFLGHVDRCPDCKEELTIQFLVQEGMQRLEVGDTFNLSTELRHLLSDARRRLRFRRSLVLLSFILEIAVAVLSVACIFLAIAL